MSTHGPRRGFVSGLTAERNGTMPTERGEERDETETEPTTHEPYAAKPYGLVRRTGAEGEVKEILLTNFVATITRNRLEDDGAESAMFYDLEATVNGRTVTIDRLPHKEFHSMEWVGRLGGDAIIYPGRETVKHAKCAIQIMSGQMPNMTAIAHVGWRDHEGRAVFVHASGAIGEGGPVEGLTVALTGTLSGFDLPNPSEGSRLHEVIRTSLRFLDAAPLSITAPLFAAIWRAPLGESQFSIQVVGEKETGKTVLASLAQQHFGARMTWQHPPANWSSTANALEDARYRAKDVLLLVDDLAPNVSNSREVDRVFRNQGNGVGRERLRSDTSVREARAPRSLLVTTGEDVRSDASATSRTLVVRVSKGDVNWSQVSELQASASDGVLAEAMAGYVRWLATQLDALKNSREARVAELRSQIVDVNTQRRTGTIAAELLFGGEAFLRYAQAVGAVTTDEAEALFERFKRGVFAGADAQSAEQHAVDSIAQFFEKLGAALRSGRAYVTDRHGQQPHHRPHLWGWRDRQHPSGVHIGWIDGDKLGLDPTPTRDLLARLAGEDGGTFPRETSFWRALDKRGWIEREGSRESLKSRWTIGGKRIAVIQVDANWVLNPPDPDAPGEAEAAEPDQTRE